MIRNYVVRVTNPVTGEHVFFNGMLDGRVPLWDPDVGVIFSFLPAIRFAARMKRLYPLVRVCGVRDSAIYIEGGVGHYLEAF